MRLRGSRLGGTPSFAPERLQGLLVDWAFNEGSGSVNNRAAALHDLTNMTTAPENSYTTDLWGKTNATATDAYGTGPTGISNHASRLVTTAAGGFLSQTFSGRTSATYTISVQIKSNTGSAQQIRLGTQTPGLSWSSPLTVPASGWTQLTYTFTGQPFSVLLSDNGSTPIDVQICGLRCEPGASASTYNNGNWDATLAPLSSGPTWGSGYIDFNSSNGYAVATSAGGITLSEFAYYALLTQTSSVTYNTTIGKYAGYDSSFRVGMNSAFEAAFNGTSVIARLSQLWGTSTPYRVLGVIYDGANLSIELDGITVATGAVTGSTSVKNLVVGKTNGILNSGLRIARSLFFTNGKQFNTATRAAMVSYLRQVAAARSLSVAAGDSLLVILGDSFSDNTLWPKSMANLVAPVISDEFAVAGTAMTGTNGYPTQRTNALALYNPNRFNKSVAVLAFGQNDLNTGSDSSATFLTNLAAAYTQLRADGFKKVVVIPTWSRNVGGNQSAYDTGRANAKAGLVIGTHCDYITPDSSFMSANGSFTTNPTYYVADGSHPSATVGYTEIFDTVKATIQTALSA